MKSGPLRIAGVITADAAVLWVERSAPAHLLRCSANTARNEPDRFVAVVAGAALWVVAVWVAIGVMAMLGTGLPGLAGRVCTGASRALVPVCARRLVIAAVGLGVVTGPIAPVLSADASPSAQTSSSSAPSATSPPIPPGPVWPTAHRTTPPARGRTTQHAPRRATRVTVRAGDSLWLIAARRLDTDDATRIAGYWPRIYAANSSVIGPTPDLLHPGQVLRLPDRTTT